MAISTAVYPMYGKWLMDVFDGEERLEHKVFDFRKEAVDAQHKARKDYREKNNGKVVR